MKPVRIFCHVTCEPPGYLGSFLEAHGCPVEPVCIGDGREVPQDLDRVAALVIMGGPGNVNDPPSWMQQELELIRRAATLGVPVLGICLGAGLAPGGTTGGFGRVRVVRRSAAALRGVPVARALILHPAGCRPAAAQ